MFLFFQRFAAAFLTFFMMLYGVIGSMNNGDTVLSYEKRVASVEEYQNTIDTALPMTDIYTIINDHLHSPLPAGKTAKKVLVLGYDGARADTLSLLGQSENSAITTVLDDGGKAYIAYCGGVNYPAFNTQKTSTAPGWCSMLTGQWADVHGITDNSQPKSNDHLTLLTTSVEDGTIDESAFYVSWNGHFIGDDATYINEIGYIEEKGLNVHFVDAGDDDGTYANVLADIRKAECSDFIFTIFEYCDHTGHDTGFNMKDERYTNAFLSADATGYALLQAVKARPTYETEDWLIVITSDHGGYNKGHGFLTIQERMMFIVTSKDLPAGIA